MADNVRQTTGNRYLKRQSLQKLLEGKFGKMDFKIILQDDQFIFTAPEEILDEDIDKVRDKGKPNIKSTLTAVNSNTPDKAE